MTEEEKTRKAEQILDLLMDLYPEAVRSGSEGGNIEVLLELGPTYLEKEFFFYNAFRVNGVEVCSVSRERMDDARVLRKTTKTF